MLEMQNFMIKLDRNKTSTSPSLAPFYYWIHADHARSRNWSCDQTEYKYPVLSHKFQLFAPLHLTPLNWGRHSPPLHFRTLLRLTSALLTSSLFPIKWVKIVSIWKLSKRKSPWKLSWPLFFIVISEFLYDNITWRIVFCRNCSSTSPKQPLPKLSEIYLGCSVPLFTPLASPVLLEGASFYCQLNESLHLLSVYVNFIFAWPQSN